MQGQGHNFRKFGEKIELNRSEHVIIQAVFAWRFIFDFGISIEYFLDKITISTFVNLYNLIWSNRITQNENVYFNNQKS